MTETFKYPAGEWTHADLADANGKTKPSVYNFLQDSIKSGKVVVCGSKSSGKGKPSKLYKVADANTPVVIAPKPQPEPPKSEPVSETPVVVNPEPVVVAEVTTEPVSETPAPVPTVDPTPHAKVEPVTQLAPDTHSTEYPCPVCKKNLLAWKDATGVMVKCLQPIEVCKSTENPFGHGKNEKEAVEVLNQKWGFAIKGSPVQ